MSHNRYGGKNIIFDQCIFSSVSISPFLIFSLSQLYGFKSNKPKNTHYCVIASLDLGYKWLKNCWIFLILFLYFIIDCSPDHVTWHSAQPNQQLEIPRFDWPFSQQQIPNPFIRLNQVKWLLIPNTRGVKWVGLGWAIGLGKTHLLI